MSTIGSNMEAPRPAKVRSFWQKFPEKEELNQYWYSVATVETLADEVIAQTALGAQCAFLSTPSVYYAVKAKQSETSLPPRELFLFDFDAKFSTERESFVHYDFNRPDKIPAELHKNVDFVVIDPPFITKEVWEQYTRAAKLLLRPTTGKILLSTIVENEGMIHGLLSCSIQRFKPSIPHLVYQYALYANYPSTLLTQRNPEVEDPEEDARSLLSY